MTAYHPPDTCSGRVAWWVATGCGVGRLPWAPGTWGSLVGALLAWICADLPRSIYLLIALAAGVLGVWACGRVAGDRDPAWVVWDEIVGVWCLYAGVDAMDQHLALCAAAWLAFRMWDIFKWFPLAWIEQHSPGGWGIMADDAAAGGLLGLLLYGCVQYGGV